jgi:hypothetical protein
MICFFVVQSCVFWRNFNELSKTIYYRSIDIKTPSNLIKNVLTIEEDDDSESNDFVNGEKIENDNKVTIVDDDVDDDDDDDDDDGGGGFDDGKEEKEEEEEEVVSVPPSPEPQNFDIVDQETRIVVTSHTIV